MLVGGNMTHSKLFTYLLIFLILIVYPACSIIAPETSQPGISEPVIYEGITIRVERAEIRSSYSTHYIMHYPSENEMYYAITTSIDGFDDAKSTLIWGEENLILTDGHMEIQPDHAQRILLGDDILYQSGESFTFQYEFFFAVPKGSDYSEYRMKLPGNQWIETSEILDDNWIESTSITSDSTVEPGTMTEPDQIETNGQFSTISGGSENSASAYYTTISGGYLNAAITAYASVGGGRENYASNLYTTVGGGYANSASGRDATIGGGSRNTAGNYHATIGGGIQNKANASDSTISGGAYNLADQPHSTVGGGTQNIASGTGAVVAGGAGNSAEENQSTVSGGLGNRSSGIYATIGGGQSNTASGAYSTIPGGVLNKALGDFSLAAGHRSIIDLNHSGSILFSDSIDADFRSSTSNEFGVRATGGTRFITSVDELGNPTTGVHLSPGSGSWSSLSDRAMKENFTPVNSDQILDELIELEISEWNYISQDPVIRHIGPMADEFYNAFGAGENARYINTIDADGISLAAIQGVYNLVIEKDHQISVLEDRLSNIEGRLEVTTWFFTFAIFSMLTMTTIFFYRIQKKHS
jgi:hypothetical protein